jgi:uncharacterized protein YegP (UPF0339 family)
VSDEREDYVAGAGELGLARRMTTKEGGMDSIVDYVEVVQDENEQWRVRGRSNNGEIIWTTEQYGDREWAQKVAEDSGKPLAPEE